jgi:hypothetical protein
MFSVYTCSEPRALLQDWFGRFFNLSNYFSPDGVRQPQHWKVVEKIPEIKNCSAVPFERLLDFPVMG